MPAAAEVLGVVLALDDLENFGMVGQALHVGMQMNFAEALGETDLLDRRQLLLAEEHHLVREERIVHVGEILVAHVGEVDAVQLGAERAGDGFHLDRDCCAWRLLRGSPSRVLFFGGLPPSATLPSSSILFVVKFKQSFCRGTRKSAGVSKSGTCPAGSDTDWG